MPSARRALKCAAVAAVLTMACHGGRTDQRARMLNVSERDPVELAVGGSSAAHLVVVYWPKVGECQACAAGVAEALLDLSIRAPQTKVVEVWPEALPLPDNLKSAPAVLARLSSAEYARQTSLLGTPRLEAWLDGRPLLLQKLDERRASADFVSQVLDHCLGVSR